MSAPDRTERARCRYCGGEVDRWHLVDGRILTVELGTMFEPFEASHWRKCPAIQQGNKAFLHAGGDD